METSNQTYVASSCKTGGRGSEAHLLPYDGCRILAPDSSRELATNQDHRRQRGRLHSIRAQTGCTPPASEHAAVCQVCCSHREPGMIPLTQICVSLRICPFFSSGYSVFLLHSDAKIWTLSGQFCYKILQPCGYLNRLALCVWLVWMPLGHVSFHSLLLLWVF